jgi:hypothetical protein
MQPIDFHLPVKLSTPIQAVHTFVGGPMDGRRLEATVHYELTEHTVMCIDNANYKYGGNDTFIFSGMTSKLEERVPTLKERIVTKVLKFLFT